MSVEIRTVENLRKVLTYLSFYVLAVVLAIFTSSYFGYSLLSSISFTVADGWCNPKTQGIGIHCFGDFYYSLQFAISAQPWSGISWPYPPLGTFLFKPFGIAVQNHPNSSMPLLVYLVAICAASITIPISLLRQKVVSKFEFWVICLFITSSAPFIVGLDRGNNILLSIPLVYFFLDSEFKLAKRKSLIYYILLVLIKPQFALLGIIFLRGKNLKRAFKNTIITFITFLASFTLYGAYFFENMKAFFRQLGGYQDYLPIGNVFPVNVSMSNTLSFLSSRLFGIALSDKFLLFLVLSVLLATLLFVFMQDEQMSMRIALVVLLLPILLPKTSSSYYLVCLIPLVILLFVRHEEKNTKPKSIKRRYFSKKENYSELFGWSKFTLLLFIPWSLPWGVLFQSTPDFAGQNISLHWILISISLIIMWVSTIAKGSASKLAIKLRNIH